MSALQAIVLGIVQGLTEFLPISSTAHLRIVSAFAGWDDPGAAFTAVVQLGTMAAVLLYFREDLLRVARGFLAGLRDAGRRGQDYRMGWYLVLGTAPIAVFGLAFKNPIENGARNLYVIGTALILFSFVMIAAERLAVRKREIDDLDGADATVVGFAQALALIPGVSRSGSTISAGLLRGFTRTAAARYSFLLSVPAVVLSGLFELRKVGEHNGAAPVPTIIATALAFVVGYVSIAWLLRFLVTHTIVPFAIYRVSVGSVVLALAGAGSIS